MLDLLKWIPAQVGSSFDLDLPIVETQANGISKSWVAVSETQSNYVAVNKESYWLHRE